MTSISLFGAFEQTEDGYPAPRYGHPKDRRTDLKQVQAGIAVTRDEGIPLFRRAYDGGAGEIAQVVEAMHGPMHGLQQIAGQRERLLIGDSKLQRERDDRGRGEVHRADGRRQGAGRAAGRTRPGRRTAGGVRRRP